jgi:DNA repair exonuclease SbcCD nuclease subunit
VLKLGGDKMTRILHIADTHIGYSAYRKMDEATGLNQREVDTYNAFEQFVDYAITDKPDAVLHAGDLFDSVRPTNRAISFVLSQILRLSNAGIPFIVIAGNHEMPRLKETGCVFTIFKHIPDVYVVYDNGYELIELGDLKVHAIPHCDDIAQERKKVKVKDGINILMLHASVTGAGLPPFMTGSFNEQMVSNGSLTGFDYVALGHFHKYTRVQQNVYYAGSTERFSFAEAESAKGFIEARFEADTKTDVLVHELRTRTMLDLKPVDCSGLDEQAIKAAIMQSINECSPADKVVRLKVLNIPLVLYHALDFEEQRRATRKAVQFEIKYEFDTEAQTFSGTRPRGETLREEFENFLEGYKLPEGVDREILKSAGMQYMHGWDDKEHKKLLY